jgi:transcriptional regulator with XRE-family HTH domain
MAVNKSAAAVGAIPNGSHKPKTNKLRDVAQLLDVKADGWYSETPEGVLSPFNGEDDPEGPSKLLEALTHTAE